MPCIGDNATFKWGAVHGHLLNSMVVQIEFMSTLSPSWPDLDRLRVWKERPIKFGQIDLSPSRESQPRKRKSRIERPKFVKGDRLACHRTLVDLIRNALANKGEPSLFDHGDRRGRQSHQIHTLCLYFSSHNRAHCVLERIRPRVDYAIIEHSRLGIRLNSILAHKDTKNLYPWQRRQFDKAQSTNTGCEINESVFHNDRHGRTSRPVQEGVGLAKTTHLGRDSLDGPRSMLRCTRPKGCEFGVVALEDYALVWWTSLMDDIRRDIEESCESWYDLKRKMRKRSVLASYERDIYHKFQSLYQGSKSVEEYHKEMELTLLRA
ncbi:hypothetical protein CR513_10378, partial [Mucuna pruriens]